MYAKTQARYQQGETGGGLRLQQRAASGQRLCFRKARVIMKMGVRGENRTSKAPKMKRGKSHPTVAQKDMTYKGVIIVTAIICETCTKLSTLHM